MKRINYLILLLFVFSPFAFSQVGLEERLKQHVYTLASDSLEGRKAGSEGAKKAAAYIAQQWEEIGISPFEGESYYHPFKDEYNNLIGIIEGNEPLLKDEYIIVGAHFDHLGSKEKNNQHVIYNGADDNASGVAAITELARRLKEIQPDLHRSVIFIAFDAEELGLYGSNEIANNWETLIEKTKLMFSVDMVGWHKKSGYVEYSGTGTIKNAEQLLLENSSIPDGLNVKTKKFEKSAFTATDTYGFAQKNIPTLAVTTGTKSPYHKPEDEAPLIDYEGLALITEHLTNVVVAASQDDSFQASGKIASKHKSENKKFVVGLSANIGNNYHYYTKGAVNGKPTTSFAIGLFGQLNINTFAIRPEVFYDIINARHPDGRITTQSVTVPVNIGLQTPASGPVGVAIYVGPYYNYKFDGKQNGKPLDFDNDYKREEFGINICLEMRLSNMRIGYTNRSALTDFSKQKNLYNAHLRNRSSFFTLSYTF